MSSLQVVVMGVSATGKSTVGAGLSEELGWSFVEGDDLHPERNVATMAAGKALGDDERRPWLDRINDRARRAAAEDRSTVITCSALTRAYRDRLRRGVPAMHFVHLHAPESVLAPRMAQRTRHFMPPTLLGSQLATLEELAPDEDGVVVDVSGSPAEVAELALAAVRSRLGER